MLRHSRIKDNPLTPKQFIHISSNGGQEAFLCLRPNVNVRWDHAPQVWFPAKHLSFKPERLQRSSAVLDLHHIPLNKESVSWVFFKSWLTQCTSNEAECRHKGPLKPQKCSGNWQQQCRTPLWRQHTVRAEQKHLLVPWTLDRKRNTGWYSFDSKVAAKTYIMNLAFCHE